MNPKKTLLIALLVMAIALPLQARTMRDLFITEHADICLVLTKTNRLDMLDYYDSGQKHEMDNNMDGKSVLTVADSDFVELNMSESRTVQMKLLTQGIDTVIAVIETFKTPTPDSKISFYNTAWIQQNEKLFFSMPTMNDFILKSIDKKKRAELLAEITFPLIKLEFTGANHNTLTASHGLKQFLVAEDYNRIARYYIPSITYNVQGIKIKRTK